ncbi:DUF411 domain-containing protein [Campylobacter blaseri]|uniref:CopG family transcriptional regulator n=1 Tax=Campylobacter blaseri TaxID=2042961 RepID=A0A2P8QYH4_9BACT|nr:DUF411 domain-containing protein [Campylobacter blaseri]PSM51313.1 CopG family transcriptional regulator [Campylobacter blaseri]PSM52457.1 CopG family transcriptional regulator [Campylobacter blaseri]QKF86212.1 DUF411 domain-containing protein [Campylobacter blaseri]
MKKIVLFSLVLAGFLQAQMMEVYKSPSCGCCSQWEAVMNKNGFKTKEILKENIIEVKKEFNVPLELSSCHTAIIDGYVVEGHVPAREVKILLEKKPKDVIGISAPGMPLESPGMEQGSTPETYNIVAFKKDGTQEIIATYIGSKKIR